MNFFKTAYFEKKKVFNSNYFKDIKENWSENDFESKL